MRRFLSFAALLALCTGAHANTCVPLQAGAADQTVYVEFIDATTGVPNSSLVFNSSGIDLEYVRSGAAAVDITEATQTAAGAHADGGFVSVGHGRYRLDLPDAAVATGVPQVVIQGTVTGYIMLPCAVALSPPVNVVRFGGTDGTFASGRPNVNASHLGGTSQTGRDIGASVLLSSGTGTGQVTLTSGRVNADVTHWGTTAVATARPLVDAVQISGDSGAADALETAFDGTAGAVSPLGIARQGTAQSATGTTLVLDTGAAFADDATIGMTLVACGSTQGYCQSRAVTDYVSSTDTATVSTWTVTPSGTITYYLFGTAPASGGGGGATAAEVWAYGDRQLTAFDEDVTTMDINATATGAAASVTGAVGSVGTGGITAASIATDAIGAAELAADAGTELGTATWASTTRLLTAGTNIVLAKGTGITGFNDLDAAGVRTALGLSSANLDTQLSGIDAIVDQLLIGVNVEQINGVTVLGSGTLASPWNGE